jgi:hypothetical protein
MINSIVFISNKSHNGNNDNHLQLRISGSFSKRAHLFNGYKNYLGKLTFEAGKRETERDDGQEKSGRTFGTLLLNTNHIYQYSSYLTGSHTKTSM